MMRADGDRAPAGAARRCPICGKPAEHDMRPFCSKRCTDVDLHRWLGGVYAVPSVEDDDSDAVEEERKPED